LGQKEIKKMNILKLKTIQILISITLFAVSLKTLHAGWTPEFNSDPGIEQLRAVSGSSEENVFAVGNYGMVLKRESSEWVSMDDFPGVVNNYGIWVSDPTNLCIAADNGKIYQYDGLEWCNYFTT